MSDDNTIFSKRSILPSFITQQAYGCNILGIIGMSWTVKIKSIRMKFDKMGESLSTFNLCCRV